MWKRVRCIFFLLLRIEALQTIGAAYSSSTRSSPSVATNHPSSTTLPLTSATVLLGSTGIDRASGSNAISTPSNSMMSSSTGVVPSVNVTTSASSTAALATQPIDPATLHGIQTVQTRRISSIIAAMGSPASIAEWLSSLGPNGKWPDTEVDYTTGCSGRRANWPAQTHWQRILIMAGAWRGGLPGADAFILNATLESSISSAMDYWFGRDFKNVACLDSGGTSSCPCDNVDNSLWNTNWFSNLILIPELVSQVCLLVNDTLTASQVNNCTHMTSRSYSTFDHYVNGLGTLTGANALDVAKIGIDQGLLTYNGTLLTDAFRRVHLELQVKSGIKADGIRVDGSFGQHSGILYNGNYGKDYTNDVLDIEIEAAGTKYAAGPDSKNALATLFDGDKWMIFRNTITGVLHWDFSALGRFISFPVIDNQATGSIKINLTEVLQLGQLWSSDELIDFANDLTNNTTSGQLVGNRMFYANDYMVHRGLNYVTTLKMYSSRTQNSECNNSQNPKGFHLSDGVLYTYLQGNEYEDVAAAWDWNLIPGITIDYNATVLACGTTQRTGIESFVGGVSDDRIGAAAMRFTNPLTKSLHWQKAWFFLNDDVQYVMLSAISSTTNVSVYTVLDQKRFSGNLIVNGTTDGQGATSAQTLWHGDVGYLLPPTNGSFSMSVQVGEKTGSWSEIGTSTQQPSTVNLFAAWVQHHSLSMPFSYTIFPGTTHDEFIQKMQQPSLQTIQNDEHISAVYDNNHLVAMLIFWDASGASAVLDVGSPWAPITIAANANLAVIYKIDLGEVTVSDPSQSLTTVQLSLSVGYGMLPPHWSSEVQKTLIFQLPAGDLAGSSVTHNLD